MPAEPSASSEPISGARSAALQRVPDQVRLIINRNMDDYQPVVCHSACSGTPCRLFAKGITSIPVYKTMPRIHFFPTSAVKARNPAVSFGFSVAAAFTSRPTIRPALSSRTISTSLPDAVRQKKILGFVSLHADCLTTLIYPGRLVYRRRL